MYVHAIVVRNDSLNFILATYRHGTFDHDCHILAAHFYKPTYCLIYTLRFFQPLVCDIQAKILDGMSRACIVNLIAVFCKQIS